MNITTPEVLQKDINQSEIKRITISLGHVYSLNKLGIDQLFYRYYDYYQVEIENITNWQIKVIDVFFNTETGETRISGILGFKGDLITGSTTALKNPDGSYYNIYIGGLVTVSLSQLGSEILGEKIYPFPIVDSKLQLPNVFDEYSI